jgi:GDP-4-dehydro-6-deoxy-D-mannose reductase
MQRGTALITGGTGSLGSVLCSRLRALGYIVVAGSRNPDASGTSIQMDVTDLEQVSVAVRTVQPDVIVHLAATFSNEFEEALAVNVNGAHNLLASVKGSDRAVRVVLAGSAAEYGLVLATESPVKEDHLTRPVSVYGLTKLWQTSLGLMCARQGQDVVVARIFNLSGSGMSSRLFVGRIEQQIREIRAGQRQRIEIGPLSAERDYISLEDAAKQLVAICVHGKAGQIYHVASGQPIMMRDLLKQQLSENDLNFSIVDENANQSNRSGYDVPVVYANIELTKSLPEVVQNEDH